jgi:hypothetical protein
MPLFSSRQLELAIGRFECDSLVVQLNDSAFALLYGHLSNSKHSQPDLQKRMIDFSGWIRAPLLLYVPTV